MLNLGLDLPGELSKDLFALFLDDKNSKQKNRQIVAQNPGFLWESSFGAFHRVQDAIFIHEVFK